MLFLVDVDTEDLIVPPSHWPELYEFWNTSLRLAWKHTPFSEWGRGMRIKILHDSSFSIVC